MNPLIKTSGAAMLASALLAGCAGMHGHHGADRDRKMGATQAGQGADDMQAMCAHHREMMGAKTPEERQAMMERHMQGMTPEMRSRHMEMMRERCPAQ